MLDEIMIQIQPLIVNIAVTVLTIVAAYLGIKAKQFLEEKTSADQAKKIIETTCQYINQVYDNLDGPAKYDKAREDILKQLDEKGIKLTDLQLKVLIESTVNSFKSGLTSDKKDTPQIQDKKD